ncbi:PQQ-binding-like beta-propeller repeat protein [Dokdonella soli]|uniref:Pyrrolo-quinoline quinone repeat domain-containing protein n=1 Tax=Dokdonella soli TaxID=529810 RepID=A0ABN1IYY2_9GAMM
MKMLVGAGWLAAGVFVGTCVPAACADWLQFNYDAAHGGNNALEHAISTSPGPANVSTLRPIRHVTLSNVVDGAPAFVAGVSTAFGAKDLLFLTTRNGELLAVDASTGESIWSRHPATGPRYTTSSPAVDPARQFVYSYGLDGYVHKYGVNDGAETTAGGWPQLATLKPDIEKGSSALTIATAQDGSSYLYVANGGYPGDAGDYQGHITAINLGTGTQNVFNANCSDQTVHFVELALPDCARVQSAIWARPGVVYDAGTDRIYMATGNGPFDGNSGSAPNHDWGDSVLALSPSGTGAGGSPLASYTPTDYQALQDSDQDLGSTAPAILPVPVSSAFRHLAAQSGKDAKIRLLNLDSLGGLAGVGHLGGELQIINLPQGGEILTQPAVWFNRVDSSTWLFIANGNGIAGLQLVMGTTGIPALSPRWHVMDSGTSPIVANGIVFYAGSAGLTARDPVSGNLLWNDGSIGGVHWQSPIVVNGTLYVTDQSGQLWMYAVDQIFRDGFDPS